MGVDRREGSYRRVGDTAKCPACGVSMDPDAYRCPRCLIYFCFKCRRRVQQRDPQFQCMNQQCPQYGKLLCNGCTVEVPRMGERAQKELAEPGKTIRMVPGKVVLTVFVTMTGIGFGAGIYFGMPLLGALFGGAIVAGIISAWLASLNDYIQPIYKNVTETVEVGRQKSCIACRQAVEHLR